MDRVIHMAFSGKMDYAIDGTFIEQLANQGKIANIAFDKLHTFCTVKAFPIAGIGKCVED